jgi:mRNA interferase MazF
VSKLIRYDFPRKEGYEIARIYTLTVVVIPFTTNLKMQNLPTCVFVPAGEGGLREASVAVAHQIRALDKRGLVACWGTLPAERVAQIERAVLRTLGVRS